MCNLLDCQNLRQERIWLKYVAHHCVQKQNVMQVQFFVIVRGFEPGPIRSGRWLAIG